jgi:predicted XRE-type DNA-binding protein
MTPRIAAWIKWLRLRSPDLFQHEIAAEVGINQGRVSEVLSGKRYGSVPPAPPHGVSI